MDPTRLRIPLLEHETSETPVFTAANLLEAARIRKGLPKATVPAGCLLDFDGELVQHLVDTGKAAEDTAWPCFHTRLFRWRAGGAEYGVIGGTVGAPFAVLVAEELFALGCRALVSISSAGLVADRFAPPFFLLIDRALRDRFREGLERIFGERVTLNGHPTERLPNTLNVNFVGRVGAEVLAMLPGVAASTGSACHAGSVTLSSVLAAMGVPPEEGMGAVRFSLGRATTWEELEEVLGMLKASVRSLPSNISGNLPG
jgi:hypothetical protein